MKLIGMLDSPFVRRVAVTMQFLGIDYEHINQSVVAGYKDFRKLNPLAKAPTLLLDDGEMLIDSTLIIDYLESTSDHSLMPADADHRRRALQIIGVAMLAKEKCVQRVYELELRPEEKQHAPWLERITEQLHEALGWLEGAIATPRQSAWLFGDSIGQADITVAVAWRFLLARASGEVTADQYPGLAAFGAAAEALPEFRACSFD